MSDTILIRPVEQSDFVQWKSLWEGYNAFYGRSGITALPQPVIDTTWLRFFNPDEPVHALVADRNGELLGLVHFIFHRTTISIAPTCYLQDLFTVESARGQGVGRRLIEHVYQRAAHAGSSRVYWLTHETNATAIRLYEKLAERSGFIVYRKAL